MKYLHFFHRAIPMAALLLPIVAQAQNQKLIEFGWDMPTTRFMRDNIAQMEKMPFDGVVFNAVGSVDGKSFVFSNGSFGAKALTRSQFASPVADLKATKFTRFTDNFLRFNTSPGDV